MHLDGRQEEANQLYRRALANDPGNENITWNYTRFSFRELNDPTSAARALDKAIQRNPKSARLLLLRAELRLLDRNASLALEDFKSARGLASEGDYVSQVECGYSIALHLTDAPIDQCVAAYRTAIDLNPTLSSIRLNLSQLLFIQGHPQEATRQLQEAQRLGLDDAGQLEAQFYLLLSPMLIDPSDVFAQIRSILEGGTRLNWNVQPNIDAIRSATPSKADLLALVVKVMIGERDSSLLEKIQVRWGK